jgi:ureidoglycolate lyase
MRRVLIEAPTPESVAPFGTLVGGDAGVEGEQSIYYDGSVNFSFGGYESDDDALVVVSRPRPRDMRVKWMERHPRHTQLFVPLGGSPYVMVLAPPNDEELPDLDEVRAFRFDGSTAFMLHRDTWHDYPYAILRGCELLIMMRNETYGSLQTLEDGESHGPDLDKKDIAARTGVTLELTFGAPQTEIG